MKTEKTYIAILLLLLLYSILSCKPAVNTTTITLSERVEQPAMPLLTQKENILCTVSPNEIHTEVSTIELLLKAENELNNITKVSVNTSSEGELRLLSASKKISSRISFSLDTPTKLSDIIITAQTSEKPDLLNKIYVEGLILHTTDGKKYQINTKPGNQGQRFGITLREKHQDDIDTYRIPGLATTNNGTLIAVYDNRYDSSVDLQGHIDVGMSRSTDGGETWEPMKTIMDMGTWGNKPEDENGIGDPAVLVDKITNTIWVSALWQHGDKGKRVWWASKPGLSPNETGQFMLVKSEDDGKTWSQPINITEQVKNSEWYLFFNGPGNGITLKDGTLVFAAQYKDKNQIPHSTLIYSKDQGETWYAGIGAKSHTTEAQVAQLSDGSIMLNMRDDRNRTNNELSDAFNGRSVAVTTDLGKSWIEHNTSRTALIEPNCMASIISVAHQKHGNLLFFSNPKSKTRRNHMTIQVSQDDGNTWGNDIEIYANDGYGYSCLTLVDDDHIGILYEGAGDLYFQKIAIDDFFEL